MAIPPSVLNAPITGFLHWSPAPVAAFLEFGQRQIGNHALAVLALLDDHLVRIAKDLLHGFEEQPLARHILGILVFVVDRHEARRLALRVGDHAELVGLGVLDQFGGLAFGKAHR